MDDKTCPNEVFIDARTIGDEDVYQKENDKHIHEK